MINTKGQLVFIDLDRFCWKGIQDFDSMHFEIERWCKYHQTDWFALMDNPLFADTYYDRHQLLSLTVNKELDKGAEEYLDMYFLLRVFLEGSRADLDLVPASWLNKVAKHAEARLLDSDYSTMNLEDNVEDERYHFTQD